MSQKPKQNKPSVVFNGFGGIDSRAGHTDINHAKNIVNFRIGEDGSLEKRFGYRFLTDLGGTLRSFITGMINGTFRGYALTDNTLYAVDLTNGEKTVLGTVNTSVGPACLFFYSGTLFLMDGEAIYSYANGSFRSCVGYVPLIGKDWACNEAGEPYEPKNILNRHVRISYIVDDPPSPFLYTGSGVASIEAVYRNGILMDPENYAFDSFLNVIHITSTSYFAGDRLEVHFTYESGEEEEFARFVQNTDAILFGTSNNNRLFFWGPSQGSTMFCSAYVSQNDLKESQKHYPDSNELYIPEMFSFTVGDGSADIQGALRHYDRLLIFTDRDAWMASADASGREEFPSSGINSDIGCGSYRGIAMAQNSPITVGRNTVWRWTNETAEFSKCNAYSISRPIDSKIPPEAFASMSVYYNARYNELWLSRPHEGIIYICNLSSNNWYSYNGIYGDHFFDADGITGFLQGSKLFLLDPSLNEDHNENGESIPYSAYFESLPLDFGTEKKKNLSRLILSADFDGGELTVTVSAPNTADVVCSISDQQVGNDSHCIVDRRLNSGRFRHATLRIQADGSSRPVIHTMELQTR